MHVVRPQGELLLYISMLWLIIMSRATLTQGTIRVWYSGVSRIGIYWLHAKSILRSSMYVKGNSPPMFQPLISSDCLLLQIGDTYVTDIHDFKASWMWM